MLRRKDEAVDRSSTYPTPPRILSNGAPLRNVRPRVEHVETQKARALPILIISTNTRKQAQKQTKTVQHELTRDRDRET